MKLVILAGGLGTRLSEETYVRPKPMVEIGGKPIIWHIMQMYAHHGIKEFVVCTGYKGEQIKTYFSNFFLMNSDVQIDLASNEISYLSKSALDWKLTIADTGADTMTGGRLKRVADYLDEDVFCLTYGDGLSNVDIKSLIKFHQSHNSIATVTAVPSPGRFGILGLGEDDEVSRFHEKPDNEMGWINGGFFVLDKAVLQYIDGDHTTWEHEPLQNLASQGELKAFRHSGFWRPMDTLRDKNELEDMWRSNNAPWRVWD